MPITYPIILPTAPGFRRAQLAARSVAGITASPFTGQQQVYSWPGEWLEMACELPPMTRAQAEEWVASLTSLRGIYGTFLLSPPDGKTPRGSAAGAPGSVDGASQLGTSLATLAWTASQGGILLPGDYIQIAKNYMTFPRAFDNAAWTKNECSVTATNITAPNGVAEAERLTPSGGATNAYVVATSTVPLLLNQTFYASVWLKAASGTPSIKIHLSDGVTTGAGVDCALTTAWQRFTVSRTLGSAATAVGLIVGGSSSWVEAEGAVDMWGGAVYALDQAARLHKVLLTAASDANGKSTLDIFPRLRESPPNFSAILTASPVGTFRLAENRVQWDIDEARIYGLDFKAIEAF